MDIKQIKGVWEAFLEVQEKKLSPKQKKHMDQDKDGDIDGADLAALRKEESEEVEESSCGGKMRKEEKMECPKCKGEGCDHCDGTGYHKVEKEAYGSKKMKESNLFSDEEIAAIEEKAHDAHTKGATKPEGIMDKESPKAKEFADKIIDIDGEKHKDFDEKGHDDASKAGRPTSQASARKGDNLSNGDPKTPKKPTK
jgi:hypothetical protein